MAHVDAQCLDMQLADKTSLLGKKTYLSKSSPLRQKPFPLFAVKGTVLMLFVCKFVSFFACSRLV
jgi:hypothetical protein